MTEIRTGLNALADAIDELKQPKPTPEIGERALSGNVIHGGLITHFSSVGIRDKATNEVVRVADDGLHVEAIHLSKIEGTVDVNGNLNVNGEIRASKIHVDEVVADVRNERSDPLSFIGKENNTAFGKGLLWPAKDGTKQFILQERPDRFFSSESIELRAHKIYMINGQNVLSREALGTSVTKSNLQELGALKELNVNGKINVNNYLFYDSTNDRLGFGIDTPNGAFSMGSFDHEFVIDENEYGFKLGTYTSADFSIISDDTNRLTVSANGNIVVHKKLVVSEGVSIGVKNPGSDVDLTVAGSVRLEGKKFEVSDTVPGTGNYKKGDIVWHANPTAYVGWICMKSGSPGEWKKFGKIVS